MFANWFSYLDLLIMLSPPSLYNILKRPRMLGQILDKNIKGERSLNQRK
jgi:hypothetical protein